ncbi:TetR/AcrR family transcriptional regulator [Nocardia sp. CA-136227]|uniref:TetR/AcrR family transcriptional regulator n=1 Tax=Nocardia sp. CA-136227 TaxID=3239979 RepID=UPI003D9676E7
MTDSDVVEMRRTQILEAAASLLEQHGYAGLSIRRLATEVGMSVGLMYHYFADKHAVFDALMQNEQRELTEFLRDAPRTGGVDGLLRDLVPHTNRQWRRAGRMAAVWRVERTENPHEPHDQLLRIARAQFAALREALAEAAAASGRRLRAEPEIIPAVWAGLMGLADLTVHGWVHDIDYDALVDLTVTGLSRQILEVE